MIQCPLQQVQWAEAGQSHSARWQSGAGVPAPVRVAVADDTMSADAAFRLASEGTAILWRGDYHNARQLLQALGRRLDRPGRRRSKPPPAGSLSEAFHRHRMAQAQRARILGMLLLEFGADYTLALRRAPDVRHAVAEAWGPGNGEPCVASLRELLGAIGAHEWRRKGVEVPALLGRIHPHYGVFAPVRGEYVDLVVQAPLPETLSHDSLAFDIGTGTGVLAAVLARRGVQRVVATDQSVQALDCARDNLQRLGLGARVQVLQADLFPAGRAPLIVCNPPWLPGRASSALEHAVYDPDSRMLRGFLGGLAAHLSPGGEGWLLLSDLAEHLGLRRREDLLGAIQTAGLQVAGRLDARPVHPRASDAGDPLHAARAAEITSLWRLRAA
ncbi:MAG: class I SAM-dependent methyltransferase [Hylemonella sp.]|nr:class I SAM-dependent methyltransferase [Hylemonella sp.]